MAQELSKDDVLIRLEDFIVDVNGSPQVKVEIGGGRRTVDPRPVYDFERKILDSVIGSALSGDIAGAAMPVKGRWIHGWLRENTDEYINGLWKNYQFFLRYLEAETAKIENISAFQKAPGTYESMYRYLLVLEEIGLIDRYRREEVPEDEYDFNVPDEFRTRTFVRLNANYADNKQLWDNPIGSEYGDIDTPGVNKLDEFEEQTDDLSKDEIREKFIEDESDDSPDETQDTDSTSGETDDTVDVDDIEQAGVSEDVSRITDLPQSDLIPPYLNGIEDEIIQEAVEQDPFNRDLDPSNLEFRRLAVLGKWATGEATPEEDQLFLYTSIKEVDDGVGEDIQRPRFLKDVISRKIQEKLNSQRPFDGVFSAYKVETAYNNNFRSEIKDRMRVEGLGSEFYSYRDGEYVDIDD